jgi:hypothetical protein
MKSSEKLFRRMRLEFLGVIGALGLVAIFEKFGFTTETTNAFWCVAGGVIVIGFWLMDCTEVILAAIKEGSTSNGRS